MDGREKRVVREVIRALQTPSGEELAAVSFSDGMCGITRDGLILDSVVWPSSELEHCLAFLERFARTSAGGAMSENPEADGSASASSPPAE